MVEQQYADIPVLRYLLLFLQRLESRRRTGHWIPRPSKGEIWARFGGVVLA